MLIYFAHIFLEMLNRNRAVTIVILIVFAVRFLLRKYPKKYCYLLWAVVAVRMVFDISIPTGDLFPQFVETPAVVQNLDEKRVFTDTDMTGEKIVSFVSGRNAQIRNEQTVENSTQAYRGNSQNETVQTVLFLIWSAGIAVLFCIQATAFFRLKKSVRQAVLLRENIYECDNLPSPFVLGMIKPKIYVPFGLNETEQEYILAHERFHIKRLDQFTRFFAAILLMVYWINPFVWIAWLGFMRDQEMSCDEAVLGLFGNRIKKEYSTLLLSFATNNRKFMAIPLAFGESDAGKRIKNVLSYRKVKTFTVIGIVAVIVTAAVVAVIFTGSRKSNDNVVDDTEIENSQSTEISSENVSGIFAEALSDSELSMEELITMVKAENWETFVDTHDITYWLQFENLEKKEQDKEDSLTDELQGHYGYEGKEYVLIIDYWNKENALEYGETPDAVDNIMLMETETVDAIGLYHADKRYYADTDIQAFLSKTYDILAEITMDEIVVQQGTDNTTVSLGEYGQDVLFDGFSGNLFEYDQYTPKVHGESSPASWYSLGGIAEWKGDKEDAFVFQGDKLTDVTIFGNHMDEYFLESFDTDDFSGLFYEYDFEIFTASESEEAGIEQYEDMITKYWVAFLGAGEDEPVYMVFFNQDCFEKEQALSYAKSVKKVK